MAISFPNCAVLPRQLLSSHIRHTNCRSMMARTLLILLTVSLLVNVLLAQSCGQCEGGCSRCSSCNAIKKLAVPCYNTNDLVIVLDASGSIGSANYDTAKSFVDKLAAAYNLESTSRVSVVTFSDTASTVVPLTNTLSRSAMSSTILAASYPAGATYTNLGIDQAIAEFASSPRTVPLNMVVLTDGASTDHSATLVSAGNAALAGINTFSVGIGSSVNQAELTDIANGNTGRVYNTNDYDNLIDLLNPLSLAICSD